MRKTNKVFLLSSILCITPIIFGLFVYNSLPMQIPTHWNINGEASRYSSKFFAIIVLPLFMFICDFVMKLFIINDPKKRLYPKQLMVIIALILPMLNILIFSMQMLQVSGNVVFSVNTIIFVFIGILFILFGLYLPKVKQNYVIGIKTPCTLNDENNWNKTHKVGGYIFLISGVLFFINGVCNFSKSISIILIILSIAVFIIPVIYSFYLYKKS